MTTGRILGGVVLVAVLFTAGCDYLSDSSTEPMSSEDYVRNAIKGLNNHRAIDDVKSDVQQAIDKLPKTEATLPEVEEIKKTLNGVHNKLSNNLDEKSKQELVDELQKVAQKLAASPNPETTPQRPWRQWLIYGAVILGAIAVAFVFATATNYVWKRAWRNVEINVARIVMGHLGSERSAQPDFTDKLTSLSSAQKEIKSNLLDLHTEVRILAKMMRESLTDRNDRRLTPLPASYPVQSDGSSQKEEPEFPVSVNDYLGKMSRYANAVKLDFQNGILVNDPDKKDELFLIRDSRLPDDTRPLFLVPGAAQFHNKQDFEIYYAKYYECAKPAMGDVWIIGPAVVERVPGGWQLREKGMLEVR